MGLFSWIIRPKNELVKEQIERRDKERFAVDEQFPLKVKLSQNEAVDVQFKVKDISLSGMGGILGSGANHLEVGKDLKVQLWLDDMEVDFGGQLVHRNERLSGLSLHTPSAQSALNYFQLITPLKIGATLREQAKEDINQSDKNYVKRVFFAATGASLTLWYPLEKPDELSKFEFAMDDFSLHGDGGTKFKYYGFGSEDNSFKKHHKTAVLEQMDSDSEKAKEIHKLFKLIMLASEKTLPKDVLSFLNPK